MDLHDNRRSGLRGCLIGFAVTLIASMLCVGAAAVTVDFDCQQRFSQNLPIYPGAQVVRQESQFMQSRQMELWVDAPAADVRDWYHRTIGIARRNDLQNKQVGATAWRGDFVVAEADQNGTARVTLRVVCT